MGLILLTNDWLFYYVLDWLRVIDMLDWPDKYVVLIAKCLQRWLLMTRNVWPVWDDHILLVAYDVYGEVSANWSSRHIYSYCFLSKFVSSWHYLLNVLHIKVRNNNTNLFCCGCKGITGKETRMTRSDEEVSSIFVCR